MLVYSAMAYREMTENRLGSYLATLPEIAARLGSRPTLWQIRKVAASDLSAVFIAEGPAGDVCIKQALPCTQDLGGQWQLPLERIGFEEAALNLYARYASGLVPRVLHYNSELALMVLERLHPHLTLRRGIIKAGVYPRFAEQIAKFLGGTLFQTSDLAMPAAEKKERIAFFCANAEIARVTEHLTFTEPYTDAPENNWTRPELDDLARTIRGDDALKRAVSVLKQRFMAEPRALIHGNLHTGAVLVTETDTKVIDPAFAHFGPVGFDVGSLRAVKRHAAYVPPPVVVEEMPEDRARVVLDTAGAGFSLGGDYIEYYSSIGVTVRRYLTERYGFPAFALTTRELETEMLRRGLDRWQVRVASGLLEQCDAVVYANYRPAAERADADLTAAYEIVEMSRPPVQEEAPVS